MSDKIWKKSHYTTTYKVRLYMKHAEYLKLTNDIYNDLIKKYFDILNERRELLELSTFNCLTQLETLTVIPKTGARKGEVPELYFEQNAPLYLRRAAINQAIGLIKVHIASEERAKERNLKIPKAPKIFKASTIFYKGMYRNFEGSAIELKLYNGEEWKWYKSKLSNFSIPKDAQIQSPTIVIYKDYILAHIPVKEPIEDITPVRFRMQEENIRVCSVMFTNTDKFAVCVILDEKGNFVKSKFISGGKEYAERTGYLLRKIKKNNTKYKNYTANTRPWKKIYEIKKYYAHKVSREITNFCIENKVRVLAYADYKNQSTIDWEYYNRTIGEFSPLALRERTIEYLTYKTYKEGILITKVRPNYILRKCYKCRETIRRKIKGRKETVKYKCKNGHEGDYYFNGAMNVAIMCLKKFGKEIERKEN